MNKWTWADTFLLIVTLITASYCVYAYVKYFGYL